MNNVSEKTIIVVRKSIVIPKSILFFIANNSFFGNINPNFPETSFITTYSLDSQIILCFKTLKLKGYFTQSSLQKIKTHPRNFYS